MFSYFYRKVTNHALWGLFVLNNTEKFRSPFLLDSGLSHVRVFVGQAIPTKSANIESADDLIIRAMQNSLKLVGHSVDAVQLGGAKSRRRSS